MHSPPPEASSPAPALRALIFDLDGTLLDSDGDIAAAGNAARTHLGLPALPVAEVARHVGWGLGHLLHHLLPDADAETLAAARAVFVAHYRAHPLTHSRALPGAQALLDALPGHPLALVTNKPMMFVEPILAGLGWSERFAVVVAGDTLPARKPDPAPLRHALAGLGLAPHEALYIGDSEVDAATAAAAGVDFVAVGWGRHAPQAARTVDRLDALLHHPAARRRAGLEIWAHRGSHRARTGRADLPLENTLPAFERALAEGAAGIELDVLATADGVAVVIHDALLGRLTGGADARAVDQLTWAELAALPLLDDHRAPRLDTVLDAVAGRVPVNVEIKSLAAVAPTAAVLRARPHLPVVVSSFLPEALAALRALAPQVPRALLTEVGPPGEAPVAALAELGCVAWHAPAQGLEAAAVAAAQAATGGPVRAWTVNAPAEAARLAGLGVAAVMTDHPAELAAALVAGGFLVAPRTF